MVWITGLGMNAFKRDEVEPKYLVAKVVFGYLVDTDTVTVLVGGNGLQLLHELFGLEHIDTSVRSQIRFRHLSELRHGRNRPADNVVVAIFGRREPIEPTAVNADILNVEFRYQLLQEGGFLRVGFDKGEGQVGTKDPDGNRREPAACTDIQHGRILLETEEQQGLKRVAEMAQEETVLILRRYQPCRFVPFENKGDEGENHVALVEFRSQAQTLDFFEFVEISGSINI